MERLTRLIALLPELYAAELIDAGGGSMAVRDGAGIFVSPTQASRQLRWKLSADDFILFPGGGEASMARAGRQPSRENKLHRAVLAARPDWNCTFLGQSWGLLSFALAGRSLHVPEAHAWPIYRNKALDLPVVDEAADSLAEAAAEKLAAAFARSELGAVLLKGYGPLIAGAEVDGVFSLAQALENIARASR
jgi:ribulose-5-phosphate 4-epimerase/fuculose-1-phosphate aldolase